MKVLHFFSFLLFLISANTFSSNERKLFWGNGAGAVKENSPSALELTLDQTVKRALVANRDIRSAAFNVHTAKISIHEAESEFDIKFMPYVSAGVSNQDSLNTAALEVSKKFTNGNEISAGPEVYKFDETYNSSVGVNLEIPLLRGRGEEVATSQIADSRYHYRSSQRRVAREQERIVLLAISLSYELFQYREQVNLYTNMEQRLRVHLNSTKAKERAGLASQLDVFRAQIELKSTEDRLLIARDTLLQKEDELKELLAISIDTPLTVKLPNQFSYSLPSVREAIALSLASDTELQQLEDDLKDSERKARIAKNETLPDVSLNLGYRKAGEGASFDDSQTLDTDVWQVGLSTSTDLLRKREKSRYRASLYLIEERQIAVEKKKAEISKKVRLDLRKLRRSQQRMALLAEQKQQAEKKLAFSKAKFNHNLTTNFDLIEGEKELQRASVEYISSSTDYQVAFYQFKANTGNLVVNPHSQ